MVARFVAAGAVVRSVSRSGRPPVAGVEAVAADLTEPGRVAEVVADADVVLPLVLYTGGGTYRVDGGEAEAAWEFAALFHFIDRRLGQRHDLVQFVAADGAAEGQNAVLRELGEIAVGDRAGQGEGGRRAHLGTVDSAYVSCRVILHVELRGCPAICLATA